MHLLQQLFAWMPFPFYVLVCGALLIFAIWVITGIIKRILDMIPLA